MANFFKTIQDLTTLTAAQKVRILDSFCAQYGYQAQIEGPDGEPIPNPETKIQCFNRITTAFVRKSVAAYESIQAAEAARQAKAAEADSFNMG